MGHIKRAILLYISKLFCQFSAYVLDRKECYTKLQKNYLKIEFAPLVKGVSVV